MLVASKELETFTQVPPAEAVARAIKAGDVRYVSARQCVDQVSGYPAAEAGKPELASPWTIGVKTLGASCYESMGHEGELRTRKHREYAAEYNRRMYEHNKGAHDQVQQPAGAVPVRVGAL
jgi:hypothetical protein